MEINYSLLDTVQIVLQIYLDKHNKTEKSLAKQLASNEIIGKLDIEQLLLTWSKLNGDETLLFQNELTDAAQMWEIIWGSAQYKQLVHKYYEEGHEGSGVYDKLTSTFYPCESGAHYPTILNILELEYPILWEIQQDFVHKVTKDINIIDKFIQGNLELIGKAASNDYYLVSNQKY